MVNEERTSQTRDSVLGQGGGLATVGAFHHLSVWSLACQRLDAVVAEDVKTLEQLGVRVVL